MLAPMSASVPNVFDRNAVARARARAERMGGDMFFAREAADAIAERLGAVNRKFARAADIGSASPARAILRSFAADWCDLQIEKDEFLRLPANLDLVTSVLALHTVNDLPGVLAQVRQSLKPDGLFVAALFSAGTLAELRDVLAQSEIDATGGISPRVAPFADVRALGSLLQRAGFVLPVTDVERTVVRYKDFTGLVRDLRGMGESNVLAERRRTAMPRPVLAGSLVRYGRDHADNDGRLRATFEIAYLTGWAPPSR
jgi:SAM-dependent methyltransferase